MVELVRFVAKALVEHPDEVQVERVDEAGGDTYELEVVETDLGLVIGRLGRTAKALRAIVRAGAAKHGRRATLEILE
jgi:predicted RNA-binding protein YlqC (UPF0109 family)